MDTETTDNSARHWPGGLPWQAMRRRPAAGAAGLWLLPALVLVGAGAGVVGAHAIVQGPPGWAVMWGVTVGMLFAFKAMTLGPMRGRGAAEAAAYVLGWVGMDAAAFNRRIGAAGRPGGARWTLACVKVMAGAVLIWGVAPWALEVSPWLAGGIGMAGMVMLMHFGVFELMGLGWRASGRDVEPIMRRPLGSAGLGEFWGRRWNLAFADVARRWAFEPMARRAGIGAATGWAFAISALAHELAISLPAGGGWGGPTVYFAVQWAGVMTERSGAGRRAGLRRGWRGRLFTMAVLLGPVGLLFHEPFAVGVIVPWMRAIGAL